MAHEMTAEQIAHTKLMEAQARLINAQADELERKNATTGAK